MQVTLTANSKKIITVAEMPKVKEIIRYFAEEEGEDIKYYANMAAHVAAGTNLNGEILKTTAEIMKNCRADDSIIEGSGDLDVWLTVYTYDSYYGFYEIGCYISDLWQVTGDNNEEIRSHMYINAFTKH